MIDTQTQTNISPARQIGNRLFQLLPAAVVALLLFSAALNYASGLGAALPAWAAGLLDVVSRFAAVFLGIFIEAAPFLLLGTLASGLVEVFLDREELARWIPRRALPGVLAGSLFGLFFPVCECGVVPFARRLIQKGVPVPVAIATLMAAPVINPIVIASTLAAFGPGPLFWSRIGFTLLIATLTGLVFSLAGTPRTADAPHPLGPPFPNPKSRGMVERGREVNSPPLSFGPILLKVETGPGSEVVQGSEVANPPSLASRLRRVFVLSVDEFFEMGRFLVTGAALAALLQTFVPQEALLGIGQGPLLSVVALMVLAALLSVCSTVDAFIALAFVGVFTPGAVLAFLVFGPMVDIKSTLMFLRVFRPRAVLYLVLLPLLMTLIAGVALNTFAPGWF